MNVSTWGPIREMEMTHEDREWRNDIAKPAGNQQGKIKIIYPR